MTKKTEKKYAWGHRELTIPEWLLEPDIWLRGIDEEMLRARLEGPQPWSIEDSLLRAGVDDEPVARASELVPKATGRSAAARELNAVRKALLRLVALGGFVPLKDYRIALASDRHRRDAVVVARQTFEVIEQPIPGARSRRKMWKTLNPYAFAGPVSSEEEPVLNLSTGPLQAEDFPVGTRRTIVTSQHVEE